MYRRDITHFRFGGVELGFFRLYLHFALPGRMELLARIALFQALMGSGEAEGRPVWAFMDWVRPGFGLGKKFGRVFTARAVADYRITTALAGGSTYTRGMGDDEETIHSGYRAHHFDATAELDRLGGSPVGVFYTYGLRATRYNDWLALDASGGRTVHSHVVGVEVKYY